MLLALSAAPRVEAGEKVAAALRCDLPPGKVRVWEDVTCILWLTAEDPDDTSGLRGTVQSRYKAKKRPRAHVKEPMLAGVNFEVVLSPVGPIGEPVDFEPCVDFAIDATIESGARGVVWSKTIAVDQRCTPPKPEIACSYRSGDGKTRDALRGKNRIESPVTCAVSKLPAESGMASVLTLFADQEGPRGEYVVKDGAFTFTLRPDKDFQSCDGATILLRVNDQRFLPLFARDLKMKQSCPD